MAMQHNYIRRSEVQTASGSGHLLYGEWQGITA